MTDLHPHWRSTQDDDIVIPAQSAGATPRAGHSVSRRPAAIIGVVLVCVAGFLLVGDAGGILGQLGGTGDATGSSSSSSLSGTGVTIHLTKDGVDPEQATVQPGQEITWTNDSDIPHILESEDIVGEDDAPLYTAAIFPGTSTTFRLSQNHPIGTFRYGSTTSDEMAGYLVVEPGDGSQTDPFANDKVTTDPFSDPFPSSEASSSSDSSLMQEDLLGAFSSSSSENADMTVPPPDNIPTNPNSFVSLTDPLFEQAQSTHQAAPYSPHPAAQPESGMETWVGFPLALLVFLFVERKILGKRSVA